MSDAHFGRTALVMGRSTPYAEAGARLWNMQVSVCQIIFRCTPYAETGARLWNLQVWFVYYGRYVSLRWCSNDLFRIRV